MRARVRRQPRPARDGSWCDFDGDSQPLGYEIYDASVEGNYRERPDKPNSGPNPDEDCSGFSANLDHFLDLISGVTGGRRVLRPVLLRRGRMTRSVAQDCVLGNSASSASTPSSSAAAPAAPPRRTCWPAAGRKVLVLEAGNNYFPGPRPVGAHAVVGVRQRRDQELDPPFRLAGPDRRAAHLPAPRERCRRGASRRQPAHPQRRRRGGDLDGQLPALHRGRLPHGHGVERGGRGIPDGTSFADWPLTYDELEPYYVETRLVSASPAADEGPDADPSPRPAARRFRFRRSRRCTPGWCSPTARAGSATIPSTTRPAINTRPTTADTPCVELRLLHRLRLPAQRQGLAGGDHPAPAHC